MKKIICLLLVFSMVFVFAACGEDKTESKEGAATASTSPASTEPAVPLSDNIYDFNLKLNDVLYTFPTTIESFESNDWVIPDDKKAVNVEPGTFVEVATKNDTGYITLHIFNDGDKAQNLMACKVGGITLSFNRSNSYTVELSKGLVVNEKSKIDDVIALWGNYTYVEKTLYLFEKIRTDNRTCAYSFDTNLDGTLYSIEIKNDNATTQASFTTLKGVKADIAAAADKLTNDLNDGIISFDGKLLALPMKVSEISSIKDWKMVRGYTKLAPNEQSVIILAKDLKTVSDTNYLTLTVFNATDKEILVEEATVIALDYANNKNASALEFAHGIKFGMSEDDFVKATESYEFYVTNPSESTHYIYSGDEGKFSYAFTFTSGKLETLNISYNYEIVDLDALIG